MRAVGTDLMTLLSQPQRDTALPQDILVDSGDLGMGKVISKHSGQRETSPFSLDSGPAWNPPLLTTLTIPSPWGLLTQGSVQVLEDTAAVVQGDIDLLLQERAPGCIRDRPWQRTGLHHIHCGQPALPPLSFPLPTPYSPHRIRAAGSPGKASQWPSPWDLLV